MKRTTVMKIFSALLCAGSALFLWTYGAYLWALWRVAHPVPNKAVAIGVIGGADGPTSVFVTVGGPMEFYLVTGAAMLAGAVGLFLWARKISRREKS